MVGMRAVCGSRAPVDKPPGIPLALWLPDHVVRCSVTISFFGRRWPVPRILFVSKDLGSAKAGAAVARAFSRRGARVEYRLDARGAAWKSYCEKSGLDRDLNGLSVAGTSGPPEALFSGPWDAVFVTLSASGIPSAELELACRTGAGRIPLYGIEEMLGGRHNPGWGEDDPSLAGSLRRLFTIMPTREDHAYPVSVVGPPQLEKYRGLNVAEVGATARRKLWISADAALVYYIGQPEPENPDVLSRLGEALAEALDVSGVSTRPEVALVVSRHSRDKGIPCNSEAHRHALLHIERRLGIRVTENSLDHRDLPMNDREAIPQHFLPLEFCSYQELVCACAANGVIVTGFATDGVVVAPHLGIPSILYLDRHGYLFGGLLRREKKMDRFPLLVVPQVATVEDLAEYLQTFIGMTDDDREERADHCASLKRRFPFPERDPAERIVDIVMQDVAEGVVASPSE